MMMINPVKLTTPVCHHILASKTLKQKNHEFKVILS